MKTFEDEETIRDHHAHFRTLKYADRVIFFDKHFGIVPFTFPPFDTDLGWYINPSVIKSLTDIFHSERRDNAHLLYSKTFHINSCNYEFSVLPIHIPQRIYFNEFVLGKFLSEKNKLISVLREEIDNTRPNKNFLEEKISSMSNCFARIEQVLKTYPSTLQAKFLQIYHNGMTAANSGHSIPVKARRKFVEIYLYAQGHLFMEIFNFLLEQFEKASGSNTYSPLSLRMKIVLLHELGLINALKERLNFNTEGDLLTSLTRIISLITSDGAVKTEEVFRYLSSLGTGHPKDCLTSSNIRVIENELKSIRVSLHSKN